MKISFIGADSITRDLDKNLSDTVKKLSDLTLQEAKSHTPIRSGNARRNWAKTSTKDSFKVENRVPYIERLEAGASRQAPRGIIGPTLTAIKGKTK
jgi:hypothetical protein